jgi:hypothetical protein
MCITHGAKSQEKRKDKSISFSIRVWKKHVNEKAKAYSMGIRIHS